MLFGNSRCATTRTGGKNEVIHYVENHFDASVERLRKGDSLLLFPSVMRVPSVQWGVQAPGLGPPLGGPQRVKMRRTQSEQM